MHTTNAVCLAALANCAPAHLLLQASIAKRNVDVYAHTPPCCSWGAFCAHIAIILTTTAPLSLPIPIHPFVLHLLRFQGFLFTVVKPVH